MTYKFDNKNNCINPSEEVIFENEKYKAIFRWAKHEGRFVAGFQTYINGQHDSGSSVNCDRLHLVFNSFHEAKQAIITRCRDCFFYRGKTHFIDTKMVVAKLNSLLSTQLNLF